MNSSRIDFNIINSINFIFIGLNMSLKVDVFDKVNWVKKFHTMKYIWNNIWDILWLGFMSHYSKWLFFGDSSSKKSVKIVGI